MVKKKGRETLSFAIKKGKRFVPLPKIPLSRSGKLPAIYELKKRAGRIISKKKL